MSDRRITVVIMTRNRREELLETLARMTALPERAPVIVADNASTDGLRLLEEPQRHSVAHRYVG
jgi:GT2 family glycosyltransferase